MAAPPACLCLAWAGGGAGGAGRGSGSLPARRGAAQCGAGGGGGGAHGGGGERERGRRRPRAGAGAAPGAARSARAALLRAAAVPRRQPLVGPQRLRGRAAARGRPAGRARGAAARGRGGGRRPGPGRRAVSQLRGGRAVPPGRAAARAGGARDVASERLRRAESAPPAPGLRLAALRPAAPRPGAKPTAPSLTGTGAGQHAAGARGQPGPDQPGSHPVANGRAPLQGFQHEQRRDLAVSLRCDARGSGFALSWDRCCRSPGTSSQIQGGGMGGWQHRSLLQHQVSSDRGPEPLPAPRMDKSAGFSYCPSCLLGQGQFWERGQPVLPATATAWERARGAGATCACSSLGCEQVGLRCLWREPSRVDQLRRAKEKDHSSPPDCWGRRTQVRALSWGGTWAGGRLPTWFWTRVQPGAWALELRV